MNAIFTQETSYLRFLKYLIPSILSMIFVSFYTTIDGYFASHYINSDALASINIVLPITALGFGLAVMLATGSGALIGIKMGENKIDEANGFFSFVFFFTVIVSIILTILGIIFLDEILIFCGATDTLIEYARPYGFWTIVFTPMIVLKLFLEYYARIDGNPKIAMFMSVIGIVLNIIINYICIDTFNMGIAGAAIGTGLSVTISALIGLIYFLGRHSKIKIVKPKVNFKELFNSIYNGSSEMLTEVSTGITTLLFNLLLLKYLAENGVAAMSVITYLFYFFTAFFFGITVGAQPLISYSYGARNFKKIKQILKYSFITIIGSSILIFGVAMLLPSQIAGIFISNSPEVLDITVSGLKLFSYGFLLIGINIFVSGYFTAIGNGSVSIVISLARTFVFILLSLSILPPLIGVNGIWLTVPLAEGMTILISIIFLLRSRRKLV